MKSEVKKNLSITVKSDFWSHRTTVVSMAPWHYLFFTGHLKFTSPIGYSNQHDSAGSCSLPFTHMSLLHPQGWRTMVTLGLKAGCLSKGWALSPIQTA